MSYTRRLKYEAMRKVEASALTGSYQVIGGPLLHPASIVKVVNNTAVLLTVSEDGVNDHDIAPGGSFYLYDITNNSPEESGSIFKEKGTQYYIKGTAGAAATFVYLVVQYVQQV